MRYSAWPKAIDAPQSPRLRGSTGGNQGSSVSMLQPPENKNATPMASNPNTYAPVKASSAPMEQATIGRSLVIKGEIRGAESLFVDGVIMGKVHGNIICSDRLDIRSEGSVTGDVVVQRISVEDGAILKGSVQVQAAEQKGKPQQQAKHVEAPKPPTNDAAKATTAAAGA